MYDVVRLKVWELLQQYADNDCHVVYKSPDNREMDDNVDMRELLSQDDPYTSFKVALVSFGDELNVFIDLDSKLMKGFSKPE